MVDNGTFNPDLAVNAVLKTLNLPESSRAVVYTAVMHGYIAQPQRPRGRRLYRVEDEMRKMQERLEKLERTVNSGTRSTEKEECLAGV